MTTPTQNQPDPRALEAAREILALNYPPGMAEDNLAAIIHRVCFAGQTVVPEQSLSPERAEKAVNAMWTARYGLPHSPAPADPQAIANAEKITRLRAAIENAIYGNGEDRMLDPVFVGRILSAVVPFVALASAPSAHSAIARELAVLPALHAVHEIQTLTRLWIEADEEAKAAEIVLKQFLPTIARLVEERDAAESCARVCRQDAETNATRAEKAEVQLTAARAEVERLAKVLGINKTDTDHIITSQRENLVDLRAQLATTQAELAKPRFSVDTVKALEAERDALREDKERVSKESIKHAASRLYSAYCEYGSREENEARFRNIIYSDLFPGLSRFKADAARRATNEGGSQP